LQLEELKNSAEVQESNNILSSMAIRNKIDKENKMNTEQKSKKCLPEEDNIKNVDDEAIVYINPFDIFTLEELQSISDFKPGHPKTEEPKTENTLWKT